MTLRVLHCIYDDPANPWVGGGGAVRVFELYRRLRDSVDVTVLTGSFPGARNETIDGVRYIRLGAERPYVWSRLTYAHAATRALRRGEYDAAVFDYSAYTPITVPRDRPVGITVHHVTSPGARSRWGPLAPVLGEYERLLLRRARCFSATSTATLRLLREWLPAEARIDLVYAGVPDELFVLPRRPAGYLLYFGRMDVVQKGLDTLLEAYALLAAERDAPELRIAGRGKDAARVEQLAAALGILECVRLLGAVDEEQREALLAGALVQLMPSRFEGFGMAAAEAMAAGVPLVATAAGSLPEVVASPEGGVLVPPDDPQALASAVAGLLDDPERRERLSASARRSAERFRWAEVAAEHLRFLQTIAAGCPPPRRTLSA